MLVQTVRQVRDTTDIGPRKAGGDFLGTQVGVRQGTFDVAVDRIVTNLIIIKGNK